MLLPEPPAYDNVSAEGKAKLQEINVPEIDPLYPVSWYIDGLTDYTLDQMLPTRVRASSPPHDPQNDCEGPSAAPSVHPLHHPIDKGLMTAIGAEPLLEASAIAKTYGAVVALKAASLAVRPGEVHALMGANGAGKSTLVKILTGAVRPDSGTITRPRQSRVAAHSPADARRGGIVSVYQEPALIPDLDIRVEPAAHRDTTRQVPPLAGRAGHRAAGPPDAWPASVPLATQRVIDLARALAIEPDVLMLDEMTAALPANLTERVLEVIGRQRGGDRSRDLHLASA